MALVIELRVVPASGKQECILDKKRELRCFLKSAAENNKANSELIAFFAKKLKLPHQSISIIMGMRGRKKKIKIDADYTFDAVLQALGLSTEYQHGLC